MRWNDLSGMVLGAVLRYDPDRVVGQLDKPLLQCPDLFVPPGDFGGVFCPRLFDFQTVFPILFLLGEFSLALRLQDFGLPLGIGFPEFPFGLAFGLRKGILHLLIALSRELRLTSVFGRLAEAYDRHPDQDRAASENAVSNLPIWFILFLFPEKNRNFPAGGKTPTGNPRQARNVFVFPVRYLMARQ